MWHVDSVRSDKATWHNAFPTTEETVPNAVTHSTLQDLEQTLVGCSLSGFCRTARPFATVFVLLSALFQLLSNPSKANLFSFGVIRNRVCFTSSSGASWASSASILTVMERLYVTVSSHDLYLQIVLWRSQCFAMEQCLSGFLVHHEFSFLKCDFRQLLQVLRHFCLQINSVSTLYKTPEGQPLQGLFYFQKPMTISQAIAKIATSAKACAIHAIQMLRYSKYNQENTVPPMNTPTEAMIAPNGLRKITSAIL